MKNKAAQELGKLGGSVKSDAKAKAVRENGKKGGRPRTSVQILDVEVGLMNFINYYNTEVNKDPEQAINPFIAKHYVLGIDEYDLQDILENLKKKK